MEKFPLEVQTIEFDRIKNNKQISSMIFEIVLSRYISSRGRCDRTSKFLRCYESITKHLTYLQGSTTFYVFWWAYNYDGSTAVYYNFDNVDQAWDNVDRVEFYVNKQILVFTSETQHNSLV